MSIRNEPNVSFFVPCSNAASNTTPAGLMLSALNGDPSHSAMGDIKQEDALRMVDSPLRDINDQ
jgi:hypothetical protein